MSYLEVRQPAERSSAPAAGGGKTTGFISAAGGGEVSHVGREARRDFLRDYQGFVMKPEKRDLRSAPVFTVGVTGGIASGKTAVCSMLAERGFPVASADEFARRAVLPGTDALAKIKARLGPGILSPDGTLDRPRLREMIASDPGVKEFLEDVIHPAVIRLMLEWFGSVREKGGRIAVVEVPLLFESGLERFFDHVLLVTASRDTRIARIMERDGVDRQGAEAMLAIQMTDAEKIPLADTVIENKGDIENLAERVDRFRGFIMKKIPRPLMNERT